MGRFVTGLTLILVSISVIFSGCNSTKGEGFAIYLTKNDIPLSQMEALSHVELADQPIISIRDIISYNAQTHEIKLTEDAFESIYKLEVSVQGKSFMVCVDKNPIYWGAFWTPISSISFDGITIWKPLGHQEQNVITLELGYPSSSFYGGEDPRNNPLILASLDHSGKLIDKLALHDVNQLPNSMKGYELYSWQQNSQWHFTLITGTNRNKTLDEITSGEDYISESGWVNVQVVGVEEIKLALSKLPLGEFIIWLDQMQDQSGQANVEIKLPPTQITNNLKDYATKLGLDFQVHMP